MIYIIQRCDFGENIPFNIAVVSGEPGLNIGKLYQDYKKERALVIKGAPNRMERHVRQINAFGNRFMYGAEILDFFLSYLNSRYGVDVLPFTEEEI